MRKFVSAQFSSEAVTQSATAMMRQAKAAALANAIAEKQRGSIGAIVKNIPTPTPANTATPHTPTPRPLVGISSPLHRSGPASRASHWIPRDTMYQVQKPLSAAEVYRQGRLSGLITPSIAINEHQPDGHGRLGSDGSGSTSSRSSNSSNSSGSSSGGSTSGSLPHVGVYAVLLGLSGVGVWLCVDHTPLHASGKGSNLWHPNPNPNPNPNPRVRVQTYGKQRTGI